MTKQPQVPCPIDEKAMTLGMDWDGRDVRGWWMQEKLEGCRAYWDGTRMWTRGGNVIDLPSALADELPEIALDGEIWCGRGRFTEARLAVQYGKFIPMTWFGVFDAPAAAGTWEQRMAVAMAALDGSSFAIVPAFQQVPTIEHLEQTFRQLVAVGGEGLILRHPDAVGYERGRTTKLLKVKGLDGFKLWRERNHP